MASDKPSATNGAPLRAWQRMLSGRRLDLLNPSPLDVEIEDIGPRRARVARPWQRKKKIRTTMTCVAFFSEMIFCVSARIVAAVLACSDPKPLHLDRVRHAREERAVELVLEELQVCQVRQPGARPTSALSPRRAAQTSGGHSQRSGVGALVRDHDRVLVRPVPNKD